MSQLFDRQLAQRDGIIKPSEGAHASDDRLATHTHPLASGEHAAGRALLLFARAHRCCLITFAAAFAC
jgi:hypothetical protein